MASITIRTRNIRWRLTPLSSEKLYARIAQNSQLRGGQERREIYRWNCATQTGKGRMLNKIKLPSRSDSRDFGAPNARIGRLMFKAKKLDVLTATDLSPTGWEDAVNGNFTFPEVDINWAFLMNNFKKDHSFTVFLLVRYVYFRARPVLTPEQKRAPNIAPIDGNSILIGLPVEWDVKVEFGPRCNGAAQRADISDPKPVPPAEPLKPLFEEHDANEERLKPFELPGGEGWDPAPWGGPELHEDLEPDPSEFEDPVEEEPQEEPLNPFEEWMLEMYEILEEAEILSGGGQQGGN